MEQAVNNENYHLYSNKCYLPQNENTLSFNKKSQIDLPRRQPYEYCVNASGKISNVIRFRPITTEEYNAPRIIEPLSLKEIQKPSHIANCTCLPCKRYKKQSQQRPGKVYYQAGIQLVQVVLESGGVYQSLNNSNSNNWDILWSSKILKPSFFQGLQRNQRVNQFPHSYECTRKDSLSKNVSIMAQLHGQCHFNFIPQSYILPKERFLLKEQWKEDQTTIWIVKPSTSACGRGIYITNEYSKMPLNGLEEYVAVRYLDNPLLLNGYKFDLRIYVAVMSFNPLRIYVHEEGLTRLATEPYQKFSSSNMHNQFMHLTNYSINKNNQHFLQNVDENIDNQGSKWSYTALKRHLEAQGVDVDSLQLKIHDILIKTILCIESRVYDACQRNVRFNKNCFELFGFDILIDEQLRPWLLEVNFSPSLAADSPLDVKIKSRVLSDLFNMARISPSLPSNSISSKDDSQGKLSSRSNGEMENKIHLLEMRYGKCLSKEEYKIVQELEDENARSGGFIRIFPACDSFQYKPFFEMERTANTLAIDYVFCASRESKGDQLSNLALEQKREERRFRRKNKE